MKRYHRIEGFLKETDDGHWVSYEDHMAVVEKLKSDIEQAYNRGYDDGRWVGYHELNQDFSVAELPDD